MFPDSELIINSDGSIYHLHLQPAQLASTIITVGDPNRVEEVSRHFDKIDHKVQNREFVTHTGVYKGKSLTVISTGIGSDNIDIVLTELDALANIDFETRMPKSQLTSLDIIRIGTSGSIQESIDVDSFLVSDIAIGLDNLMHFYDAEQQGEELLWADGLADYFEKKSEDLMLFPYVFKANNELLKMFEPLNFIKGNTLTAPGFYAPQGRILRGGVAEPRLLKLVNQFKYKNQVLTNIEMETAAIYGMARLLNHRAISFSAILANRVKNTFSKTPKETVERLIEKILNTLVG